jgi:hypothetical protein
MFSALLVRLIQSHIQIFIVTQLVTVITERYVLHVDRYCVPNGSGQSFKKAMTNLVPELINKQSEMWLPADAVMVSVCFD